MHTNEILVGLSSYITWQGDSVAVPYWSPFFHKIIDGHIRLHCSLIHSLLPGSRQPAHGLLLHQHTYPLPVYPAWVRIIESFQSLSHAPSHP